MRTSIALVALSPLLFGCIVHTDDHVVMGLSRYPHARSLEFAPSDADVRRLVIRTDVGDVSLRGGAEENRIVVRVHERMPQIAGVSFAGGMLVLDALERDALLGDVEIEVACDLADLVLDSGVGEISFESVSASGRVEITCGSGGVSIRAIENAREVRVDCGEGDVWIDDCEADTLVVETGAGGVSLRRVRSFEAHLETGIGNVEVEDCTIRLLAANTGLGDIDILGGRIDDARYDTGLGTIDTTP